MQCVLACIDANGADGYSACRPGHCSCSSCPSKPHPTLRAVEGVSTAGPSHSQTCATRRGLSLLNPLQRGEATRGKNVQSKRLHMPIGAPEAARRKIGCLSLYRYEILWKIIVLSALRAFAQDRYDLPRNAACRWSPYGFRAGKDRRSVRP